MSEPWAFKGRSRERLFRRGWSASISSATCAHWLLARERSVGARLDTQHQFGIGFDFIRVFLAISVVATHAVQNTFGSMATIASSWFWLADYFIISAFFALSGFLVAASGRRMTLKRFLAARMLRIIPALAVEIILSALVLGPALTTFAFPAYVANPEFARYFGNIFGFVSFSLPGVFAANPLPSVVNGALWTVPYEILCYALISAMMLTGCLNRRGRLVPFFAILAIVLVIAYMASSPGARSFMQGGIRLLPAFTLGCLVYLFRFRVPFNLQLAVAAVLLLIGLSTFGDAQLLGSVPFRLFVMIPVVYLTIFFGLVRLPKLPLVSRGDYSYGIYLYHSPLQQSLVHLTGMNNPGGVFAWSVALVMPVAILSWHYVEKPILRLRNGAATRRRLETLT